MSRSPAASSTRPCAAVKTAAEAGPPSPDDAAPGAYDPATVEMVPFAEIMRTT